MIKKILGKKLEGFTLIEVAMVLLVVGIIMAAMFKGKDLIDNANMRAVVSDIEIVRMHYLEYVNSTGTSPDAGDLFKKLHEAGLIDSEEFKKPKLGTKYEALKKDGKLCLTIKDGTEAKFLTAKQAAYLKTKLQDITQGAKTDPETINMTSGDKYSISVPLE